MIPAIQTLIDALREHGVSEGVIQGLVDNDALRCGYCGNTLEIKDVDVGGGYLFLACPSDGEEHTDFSVSLQDRTKRAYCTQNDGDCRSCSLVSYNHDCHNNPILPSIHTFSIQGFQAIEKTVTPGSQTSSRVYVPKGWEGKRVMIVLLEPLEE